MGFSAFNSNDIQTSENPLHNYFTKGEWTSLQDITNTNMMEEQIFHDVEDVIDIVTHVPDEQLKKLDKQLADFQQIVGGAHLAQEVTPIVDGIRGLLQ